MNTVITNIEDVKDNIKWIDIFDLQIIGMPDEQIEEKNNGLVHHYHLCIGGFSGYVSEVGFGDNNDIFVIYQDFDKGKTLNSIDDKCLSEGIRLVIADRDGTPIGNYTFEGCKLVSKVPIVLGYDNTYVIQRRPHILVFKYSKIYKTI